MKQAIRYALISGAVVVVGVAIASWQRASGPVQQSAQTEARARHAGYSSQRGRLAQRYLGEYDLNHDGKVTREEMIKVAAERFAAAARGASAVTADQFATAGMDDFRTRTTATFTRIDWNGDGRLSLDEYFVPVRAEFQRLDRSGTGSVACNRSTRAADNGRARRSSSSRGAAAFCRDNDLNNDGIVTREELDKAVAAAFAKAAGGGASLSREAFAAIELARYRQDSSRTFQRLDRNKDGKLTEDEYAARDARTFDRLDRNKDGVLTRDELSASRGRRRTQTS